MNSWRKFRRDIKRCDSEICTLANRLFYRKDHHLPTRATEKALRVLENKRLEICQKIPIGEDAENKDKPVLKQIEFVGNRQNKISFLDTLKRTVGREGK